MQFECTPIIIIQSHHLSSCRILSPCSAQSSAQSKAASNPSSCARLEPPIHVVYLRFAGATYRYSAVQTAHARVCVIPLVHTQEA